MRPGARVYLSPRITYILQVLKTKTSKLRAEVPMVSSVVYAGRWRVNNFSYSSRVSKPSTCHPHPGQNTTQHRSERGWPSAIIWNQRGGHCYPFVFQASLWGFSLEVFKFALLLTIHGNQSGIFPSIEQQWRSKSFKLKLMVFLLQKGISWHGFAPRSWQVHPFVSWHQYLIASKPCSESSHMPTAT